mmetsp:Transcript_23032/g.69190  ORF Transcript_23032/g.69190 Transcript_23032/m.69190 type:complete len:254 (-) Transcript_23032:126-887(-)
MVARVLAICALASASLVDDDHVKRELQGADNTDALTSKWTSPELTGNLKVIQDTKKWWGRTRARWVVNLKAVDYEALGCTDGGDAFPWHVHAKWDHPDKDEAYGEDCGPAFTGGHYDPTFGCGPASDNQPEECAKVGRGKDDGEAQTCDVMADVSTCELGDLSGKTRKVSATTGKQAFDDPFFTNLDNVQDLSIVFHCGDGKRVACAKLRGQEPPIGPIGGETDAQGCYISAGYSWCASSEKCIRTWETECPA